MTENDPLSLIPAATTSEFLRFGVDEDIPLFSGELECKQNKTHRVGSGKLWFAWAPYPSIKFSFEEDMHPDQIFLGECEITLRPSGKEFKAQILQIIGGTDRGRRATFFGVANPVKPKKRCLNLKKVVFNVPNLPHINGLPVKHQDLVTNGRVILKNSEWKITLDPIHNIAERNFELRETSGYVITYVGVLEKRDSSLFSDEVAEDILLCLDYLLSFAVGYWTNAFLFTGFDLKGEKIWEEWTFQRFSRFISSSTWFDPIKSESLRQLFPDFLRLWQDSLWGDSLSRAIYWFIEGNRNASAVETTMITTQAALELLIWVHYIEDKAILSAEGFDKLPASDRIRLALSNLKMANQIPSELTNLVALSKKLSCEDGPHILTEIRNKLIHPKGTTKRKSITSSASDSLIEAQELGLLYLELFILWLCGFNGKYAYRLRNPKHQGQVQQVPWLFQTPTTPASKKPQ